MATIYALVRIENTDEPDFNSFHIYSKQTSNFEIMKAYAKEIKHKYPKDRVVLMSRENAKKSYDKYMKVFRRFQDLTIEIGYQKALMKSFGTR